MDFKIGIPVLVVGIMLAGMFGSSMVSANIATIAKIADWAKNAAEAKDIIKSFNGDFYFCVAAGLDGNNSDGSHVSDKLEDDATYPSVEVRLAIPKSDIYSGYAGYKYRVSVLGVGKGGKKETEMTSTCDGLKMYTHAWIKGWDKGAIVECW